MSAAEEEELISSPPSAEIETNTEAKILLAWLKANWDLTGVPSIRIDWNGHPSRTVKDTTVNVYRIISNVYDKTVGSHAYKYDVPVIVDVYVRDAKAVGLRDTPSPRIVKMEIYIMNLINVNRKALQSKGIKDMVATSVRYVDEPQDQTSGRSVWFHMQIQVRMVYYLFRVPVQP